MKELADHSRVEEKENSKEFSTSYASVHRSKEALMVRALVRV
jgi:hypothetical protein